MVAFGMEVNPSVDASSMTYYGAYTELMVPSTCSQPVGAVQGTGVGLDYWGTGACDSIFGGFTYVTLWSDINCADIEAANFPTFHEGTGTIGQAIGSAAGIYNQGGGTITNGWAFQGIQQLTGTTAPNSTTTNGNCFTATIAMHGPCTLVNGHGLHVQSPELNLFHEAGTPTLSHCVGVYIEDQTVTGNGGVNSDPWGIYEANATEKNLLGILMLGGTDAGISRLGAASLAIGNGTAGNASGSLKLTDLILSGTKNTTIASGATGADWTLTLPTTKGTNLYVLQTDGSGNTSWVAQTPSGAGVYLPLAGGTMTGVLTLEASAAGLKDATGSAGVNGNVLTINGSGYPVWAAPAAAAWASLSGDLTETQVIPFDGGTPGTKDTIISRSAPGTVAIGTTGSAGDYSGSLTLQSENIIGTGTSTTNGMLVLSNPTATAIGTLQQIKATSSTSILIFAENYYYNGSSLVRTDTSKGGVRFQMNAASTNSGNVYTSTIGDTSGNDNVAIQQQLNGSAKAVTQFIAPIISTGVLGFDSGSAADTGISRTATGVLAVGNGSNGDASGQIACAVRRNTGFTVANLPSTAAAGKVEGAMAYATNGLKPTELTGYGTGVPVFYSAAGPAGAGWYSYPGLALVAS